ncbi:sugar phosphate isomerase/epimerase family protein [Priestia endophytica]|uniref:sugar phosphate isomerase/epimerase family protein n=1 Tax=Priestia endophytica TaxID=135735 RepID=UPI000DCA4C69|nr:sugar phosphate isomerase/epimerase family protein [Priestia endophytica]RAS83648.1 xylose isomerase [Priestia endophytica]
MRESLHDFMKVGIVHFMAYPQEQSSEDYLHTISSIIEDEFFGAIEIKSAPDEKTVEQARRLLESSGMTVGFSAHPILIRNKGNLNAIEEEERQRAVDLVKGAVDQAYQLGAKNLAFLSGKDPGFKDRERAVGCLIESIQEICKYVRSKGNLEILLEPFDHQTDFRCLIGPSELAVEVAHEVRKVDPSFGLMVDLSHLPMLGESSEKALTTTREYLKHAHMGNCLISDSNDPLYGDKHPRFGYPGSEIDIPELTEYLRTLLDIGYLEEGKHRTLSFEIKPSPGESSQAIITQAKRTLRAAWQRV